MKPRQLGYIEHGTGKHQSNIVWDIYKTSPAITTIDGGGTQQIKVLVNERVCRNTSGCQGGVHQV